MSNRPTLFFVLSLGVGEKRNFRLFFLLPMWVALDLADALDDFCRIAAVLCKNAGYRTIENKKQAVSDTLRTTCGVLTGCMMELAFETGPLDIVDIDVNDRHGAVRLKLLTR